MKNILRIFKGSGIICLMIVATSFSFKNDIYKNKKKHSAKFTILYDNYGFHKDAKTAWDFSRLIEGNDKTILF